jgi:hypothetical protein
LDKSANWKAAPCVKRFVRDVKEYMMRCAALGGGALRACITARGGQRDAARRAAVGAASCV